MNKAIKVLKTVDLEETVARKLCELETRRRAARCQPQDFRGVDPETAIMASVEASWHHDLEPARAAIALVRETIR